MNFPGLALRCYCDALSTTAEQVTSLIPSVALRNVFFLVLQVLYIASPRCAGLLDGHSPSEIWEPRDGRLAFEPSVVAYDYRLNLTERRLSITWMISGCRGRELTTHQQREGLVASTGCLPDRAVEIYLSNASEPVFFFRPFLINPTHGPLWIPKFNSFRTEHELRPSQHSTHSYTFETFAFIVDPTTNLSIDIARFAVTNSLNGFTTSSHEGRVTKQFVYDTSSGRKTLEVEARALEVEIRHSNLAQAFTMCVFATNWALTIASTYTAFEAMAQGRVNFAAAIAHGSIALAIVSIRQLYLGPPPFGAFLDTVGFISQIATVALCNLGLLCAVANRYLSPELSSNLLEKT